MARYFQTIDHYHPVVIYRVDISAEEKTLSCPSTAVNSWGGANCSFGARFMKFTTRSAGLLVCLAAGIGLTGCGENLVLVRGKVHTNGKVLLVKKLESGAGGNVQVLFYPADKEAPVSPHSAIYNIEDGTFTVPGDRGNGIPPGKYKVEVKWQDNYPIGPDKMKGAFSREKSQILLDIPAPAEVSINVANPPTGK